MSHRLSWFADWYQVKRYFLFAQTQYPLHFGIVESADKNRAEIESDGLQQQILRCMTCFHMSVTNAAITILLSNSLVDRR